ncbi:histidine kinase [Anaerolinea thermolimosa]|uniref:sensor histidine kinase n=1 Tax=Anaerolinea thermolimosa TaxID=229919 RepID=UPI0007864DE4|nr:ATP-binding protein [Anaerolinea thermolimosa]GAP06417.1 histidine kinase [Anaerolinea thermolimosa]
MIRFLRSRLAWKVFLSYVVVVLVGVVVLATAIRWSAPVAFERHMARMGAMMSGGGMMGNGRLTQTELFTNYTASVREALTLATFAALAAAVLASFFISRQVVIPIQKMMRLSQRIADGEFHERLNLSGGGQLGQLDELDQLALSFNQMAEKLKKTETMRRQLIGDVTHELRTPLAAVRGYIEGMMDGVFPAGPETYQLMHGEIERLQRLVDDLQELSRVEAGAFKLNPRPVSINNLVETVRRHFERQFEEKGVVLETRVEAGLPEIKVDPDRILQVLTNLVGNALQYTPAGGKVQVYAFRDKSEIHVSVADTGIGIAPQHLPFIFNRFYRADPSRTRTSGGSGIGLTIAQALVKAHEGRIWAESKGEGRGSTFHFTLPINLNSPFTKTLHSL